MEEDCVSGKEKGKAELKQEWEEWVYRISVAAEWEELQRKGSSLGGDLDRSTRCIHLSRLHQVKMVLANFFAGRGRADDHLYLLQISAAKLGEHGLLVYESADDSSFPHFYGGPDRSFAPLPLDAVVKAEKLLLLDDATTFTCTLLHN